jgi:hypothetical protein
VVQGTGSASGGSCLSLPPFLRVALTRATALGLRGNIQFFKHPPSSRWALFRIREIRARDGAHVPAHILFDRRQGLLPTSMGMA